MPEELLQGLTDNSREIFSGEELAEFLEEWADRDGFAEDLAYVAGSAELDNVPPERVFEHLASTDYNYSIEEMVALAEEWSNEEWKEQPDISGTGGFRSPFFNQKVSVPFEESFMILSGDYRGSADFTVGEKSISLLQHKTGWFETEAEPLDKEEMMTVFNSLERLKPSESLHETDYDGVTYLLNSEDVNYFFEFEDQVFDGDIYSIQSNFGDFFFEAYKLPREDRYRTVIFSCEGDEYPLEAYEDLFGEKLVNGMKTRLNL